MQSSLLLSPEAERTNSSKHNIMLNRTFHRLITAEVKYNIGTMARNIITKTLLSQAMQLCRTQEV